MPVLLAEWTKFRSVRSTLWAPVVMMFAVVGVAVLVGLTGSLQPDDTILGASVASGAVLGQLVAAAFGAVFVSSEYGSGIIESTLRASPKRSRVLWAKVVLIALVSTLTGLAGSILAFGAGRLLIDGAGHAVGDPMPALLGVAAAVGLAGVLGVAFGFLIRHPAGSVAAVVAFFLLPTLLGPMLGGWQRWVVGLSPGTVVQKLAQSSDALGAPAGGPSLAMMAGYCLLAVLVAGRRLNRRDA